MKTAILRRLRHDFGNVFTRVEQGEPVGNILAHTSILWTDTFCEAEDQAAIHTEKFGMSSFERLHVGLALTLNATEFLTYDTRQASMAKAAGLNVKP